MEAMVCHPTNSTWETDQTGFPRIKLNCIKLDIRTFTSDNYGTTGV